MPFRIALVALLGLMLLVRRDHARFAALVVVAFIMIVAWQPGLSTIETTRSFFGVHRVAETPDRTHRILYHGTTIHGAERVREADGTPVTRTPESVSYYYQGGPMSQIVPGVRAAQGGLKNVAVVGLGAGSLACYAKPGENWTFFEIDPEVVRLARDPSVFRYLSRCTPQAPIVLGDARLTLTKSTGLFDLIMLDAFTSDAVPVHLITREALRGYLARLTPRGVIMMHISNRHMELANVAAALGAAENLVVFTKRDDRANDFAADYRANAHIAMLARNVADLGPLPEQGWVRAGATKVAPWTDDYSDIIGAILRKKMQR